LNKGVSNTSREHSCQTATRLKEHNTTLYITGKHVLLFHRTWYSNC